MEFFQAIANMSGDSLAQHLANGISLGSLYALIAIGYTMVYGILLMINFAHGDIVMMACYFAFFSLVVLLHIVNHTKTGMAMRAVSKDYEIARVMGVDIDKIISITFIIGSSLAAIGAIMWGIRYPGITPMMGVMPGLKCFIAAVIGGIGNIKGAVLGGFILGLGEILIVAFFPQLSGYRDAFAFIVLIVILFYKPTGLLGEKTTEKV